MGEQAATFDEQSGGRSKEHDPAGVGSFSDEDFAGVQGGFSRVFNDPYPATNDAGAATDAFPFIRQHAFGLYGSGLEGVTVADGTASLKPVGGRVHLRVGGEFRATERDQAFE